MKLKKWMYTLVAVLATSVAFAGNTSELRTFITQFFGTINYMVSMAEDEDAPEVVAITQTAKALKLGLLQYDTELTANNLSEQGQIIDESFRTITATFNKIQNSSDEVMEELIPQVERLTTAVVNSQTKVQASQVDQEMAFAIMLWFTQMKAEQEGTLLVRASRVLQQEMMSAMEGLMGEEE